MDNMSVKYSLTHHLISCKLEAHGCFGVLTILEQRDIVSCHRLRGGTVSIRNNVDEVLDIGKRQDRLRQGGKDHG